MNFRFEESKVKPKSKSRPIKRPRAKEKIENKPEQVEEDVGDSMNSIDFSTKLENGRAEIILPLRTFSPNQFEPWQKRAKREKAQKRAVTFAMIPIREHLRIPCTLRFTRYAPKFLDAHDNLRMSVKKIVDQTCAEISNDFLPGRADGNEYFTFEYDQIKSKQYGVKIEIFYENNK